jgi:hypothetical protein
MHLTVVATPEVIETLQIEALQIASWLTNPHKLKFCKFNAWGFIGYTHNPKNILRTSEYFQLNILRDLGVPFVKAVALVTNNRVTVIEEELPF